MSTKRDESSPQAHDERTKKAYTKPAVKVEAPTARPEVLGGASHVGCDVDADCPGTAEAG